MSAIAILKKELAFLYFIYYKSS